MLKSAVPPKFPIPFAANAGDPFIRPIPVDSQIGIDPGAASLNDGYVPLNATPISAGGIPPFMQDTNGLMKQATQWLQWQGAGGLVTYDAEFSTAIAGYPGGAFLASTTAGKYWFNTVDGNEGDPDAGASGWIGFDPTGSASTGDVKFRPTDEDQPGWIKANALTIGNAASGATSLASPTARALFRWHWLKFPNTQCPVLPGGHGANPDADFDANKTIQVLDWKGTGVMGMDTMGGGATTRLSGVPVVSGNATTPGSILGENLHTLVNPEIPEHVHPNTLTDAGHFHLITNYGRTNTWQLGGSVGAFDTATPFSTSTNQTSSNITLTNAANTGGGGAHNTVDRSMTVTVYLKL